MKTKLICNRCKKELYESKINFDSWRKEKAKCFVCKKGVCLSCSYIVLKKIKDENNPKGYKNKTIGRICKEHIEKLIWKK